MNPTISRRCRVILVLAVLALAGWAATFLWSSPLSSSQVAVTFIKYTSNAVTRVALFEITNQSEGHVEWSLYADGRERDHRVAVTDLVETNGELRHIGSGGPLNLFTHDFIQFATDEFHPGQRVWIKIRPYPPTSGDKRRERVSGWLYRLGWRRAAFPVKPGVRVNGPVLPESRKEPDRL